MPRYRAEVAHDLGQKEAVARLKATAEKARSFSDLDGSWDGNTFTFSASVQGIGLKGTVSVEEDSLKFDGRLPLIAMPFAGWLPRILRKALEGSEFAEEGNVNANRPEVSAGERPSAGGGEPTVLFLHIPKAGGTTLGEYVFNQCRIEGGRDEGLLNAGVLFLPFGFFKEPDLAIPENVRELLRRTDLRAVVGHFWYGIHEYVGRPSTYVTILRDPAERIVSLYHYLKLEDRMSLEGFVSAPSFKEMDNDQTRRIAGVDPELGGCSEATLQTARENLRRHFSVVGTTERFDETLVLLKRKLGWEREIVSYPKNVNPARTPASALSRKAIESIRKWNELDYELWRDAARLLDESIEAEGDGFRDDLERYVALRPATHDSVAAR